MHPIRKIIAVVPGDSQQDSLDKRIFHTVISANLMYCKKVKNDKGYWDKIETYLSENTDASFSHHICDECAEKQYPRYSKKKF